MNYSSHVGFENHINHNKITDNKSKQNPHSPDGPLAMRMIKVGLGCCQFQLQHHKRSSGVEWWQTDSVLVLEKSIQTMDSNGKFRHVSLPNRPSSIRHERSTTILGQSIQSQQRRAENVSENWMLVEQVQNCQAQRHPKEDDRCILTSFEFWRRSLPLGSKSSGADNLRYWLGQFWKISVGWPSPTVVNKKADVCRPSCFLSSIDIYRCICTHVCVYTIMFVHSFV